VTVRLNAEHTAVAYYKARPTPSGQIASASASAATRRPSLHSDGKHIANVPGYGPRSLHPLLHYIGDGHMATVAKRYDGLREAADGCGD